MATKGVTKDAIRARAFEEGFAQCGFAAPEIPERHRQRLHDFVGAGQHGTMAWMEGRQEERANPQTLWPEVKTVISLGYSYAPTADIMARIGRPTLANISAYAWGRDYHDIVKKAAKRLGRWILAQAGEGDIKVFVDTAPVMEKPLAQQAGLGWQGKHTNLVSGQNGSWLFLAEIYLTLTLDPDPVGPDQCGSCTRCLDVCPTQAMPTPYTLDATKCLAYLSIEHDGPIPEPYRKAMGNRIYGCDDCLAVCPWNKFAEASGEARFLKPDIRDMSLAAALQMTEEEFRRVFSGSPIKRIKWHRWIRNALICAGNSEDPDLKPLIAPFKTHPNATLREAAQWAWAAITDRAVIDMSAPEPYMSIHVRT